jgi:large subunit ribosomal protein L23
MNTVVIRPLITEKTLTLASRGWYTFMVGKGADKTSIGKDVSQLYKVNVVSVRTISMHGKVRRVGRQMRYAKKADWKKALVQLKAGQKIDAFEIAPTEQGAVA